MKKRLIISLCGLLLLLAALIFVLPEALPWNRLGTLYGLADPVTKKQVTSLPAGQSAELIVYHTNLQGNPECYLTAGGRRVVRVPFDDTAVTLPAELLSSPGTLEFRLEYVLCPFVSLRSNSALIEVE